MSKPSAITAVNKFSEWRAKTNSLISIAAEVVESASAPTVNDDITFYEMGTLWIRTSDSTAFVLVDNTNGAAVWVQLGATPGALKDDGTVPLTTDWDAGSHQIRAETFYSDGTGVAPFTVASAWKVSNLNADMLDDLEGEDYNRVASDSSTPGASEDEHPVGTIWINTALEKAYVCVDNTPLSAVWTAVGTVTGVLKSDGSVTLSANWDAGSFWIRAEQFQSDVATGTAPLTVQSTTKVTNLNADALDGLDASAFLRTNGSNALSADWNAGTNYQIQSQNILKYDTTVKVASFTAVEGWLYSVDTDTGNVYSHGASASNVSVTLPSSPSVGDNVGLMHVGDGDVATPAANENLTILRNGSNIMGVTDDLNVDVNNTNFRLTYVSAGWGWQVTIL